MIKLGDNIMSYFIHVFSLETHNVFGCTYSDTFVARNV